MKISIKQVAAVIVISLAMFLIGVRVGVTTEYGEQCLGQNWYTLTSMRWDALTNKTLIGHDLHGGFYDIRIGLEKGILTSSQDSEQICVLVQNLYSALSRNAPTFTTILAGGDTLPIDAVALQNALGTPPYLLVIYVR